MVLGRRVMTNCQTMHKWCFRAWKRLNPVFLEEASVLCAVNVSVRCNPNVPLRIHDIEAPCASRVIQFWNLENPRQSGDPLQRKWMAPTSLSSSERKLQSLEAQKILPEEEEIFWLELFRKQWKIVQ